jgi:glycerophosphoryl diester phosphodiesterase
MHFIWSAVSTAAMIVVGHRGARAIGPENTLRAIRAGMRCADYVEVDVRLSRDNIPVIMHDALLDRTTGGAGPVGEMDLAELKMLDAGEGEEIPTLEEVCQVVRGRCGLFVELKEPGSEEIISVVLKECGPELVWIVSFHAGSIRAVKELWPEVTTGLIFSQISPGTLAGAVDLGVHAILPKFRIVTPDLVRRSRRSGMKVISWTLNTGDEYQLAHTYELDGIATDNPCAARDYFPKNSVLPGQPA